MGSLPIFKEEMDMAYQITRAARVQETLELTDEKTGAVTAVEVDIQAEKLALDINRSYNAVIRAQMAARDEQAGPEAAQALGEAVNSLFSLIFGDAYETVLDFFDGNYLEMLMQVTPFVQDVVILSLIHIFLPPSGPIRNG